MNRAWQRRISILIAIATGPATLMGQFEIAWSTVDGGGGTSTGGGFELSGTAGQPDAGSAAAPMTGGAFELVGGFWPAFTGAACAQYAPADFDKDCDVDADDVNAFKACASRDAVPRPPGCEAKDFDSDNDCDMNDFAAVQRCYSGANVAGNPNCAQ